jgi:hypothetical protein
MFFRNDSGVGVIFSSFQAEKGKKHDSALELELSTGHKAPDIYRKKNIPQPLIECD